MVSDYEKAHPNSVALAFKALEQFDGHPVEIALPALIVLVSEIVSQLTDDSREVEKIMQGIADSVFMNCAEIEKSVSTVN